VRILIITPFYAPDLGPSAALYEMLSEELVRLGNEVSVISAVPHYPTGRVSKDFRGRLFRRENRDGVDVTRVWVPSVDRSRLSLRLLSFLCYQLLAAFVGIRRRYDVVIVSNPAFEIALPLFLLGFVRRKHVIYSVHEIYPDVGVKLGIFRHGAVISFVEWMERFCCNRAAYVRVISEGYKRALEAKGVPSSKLAVIWDWIDTDFVRPMPRRNAFSTQWGLDDLLVVMYAGNIGPTQGLESVVQAAQLLTRESSIRFIFVGDGTAKPGLEQLVRSKGLKNVVFIPFQPREMLPQVLATADVSLVTLKKGLGADSVPSKFYSILASGRPVVAAVDSGSDISALIRESRSGMISEPENPSALVSAILDLARDATLRRCFGENGRNYVSNCRSKRQAAKRFQELILRVSDRCKRLIEEEGVSESQAASHG
jgi:colanic acid biosynthesis glycosyl transferase WcaI